MRSKAAQGRNWTYLRLELNHIARHGARAIDMSTCLRPTCGSVPRHARRLFIHQEISVPEWCYKWIKTAAGTVRCGTRMHTGANRSRKSSRRVLNGTTRRSAETMAGRTSAAIAREASSHVIVIAKQALAG